MDRKGILLVIALVSSLVFVSTQAIAQAVTVPNAISVLEVPAPLNPDSSVAQTQTWLFAALVVVLVVVYIALFLLILKHPRR